MPRRRRPATRRRRQTLPRQDRARRRGPVDPRRLGRRPARQERRRQDDADQGRAGPDQARRRHGDAARRDRVVALRRRQGAARVRPADGHALPVDARPAGRSTTRPRSTRGGTWRSCGSCVQDWQLSADDKVGNLSVGTLQKLAIVLALGHEPELLVLDEPAASLDPAARRDFLKALLDIAVDGKRTILFSTHITSDLERVADRVAILRGGKIVYDGELDELKDAVKRLHVTSSRPLSPTFNVPGAMRLRVEGNEALVSVRGASQQVRRDDPQRLRRLRPRGGPEPRGHLPGDAPWVRRVADYVQVAAGRTLATAGRIWLSRPGVPAVVAAWVDVRSPRFSRRRCSCSRRRRRRPRRADDHDVGRSALGRRGRCGGRDDAPQVAAGRPSVSSDAALTARRTWSIGAVAMLLLDVRPRSAGCNEG